MLDLTTDFPTIADTLQPVTLRRMGSSLAVALSALRRAVTTREAEASGGKLLASDVVWHLPAEDLTSDPRPGDRLIDAASTWWTLLEVRHSAATGRWSCQARDLTLAAGLDATVTIQRAVWRRDRAGAAVAEWRDVASSVPARVQPVETTLESIADGVRMTHTFRITLAEPLDVAAGDRVVDEAGNTYHIRRLHRAERIDVLPQLDVERIAIAAAGGAA